MQALCSDHRDRKHFFGVGGWGALAPGHGTEMHKQQNNTDNSTETRAQTSLCHTICICYISVVSTILSIHSMLQAPPALSGWPEEEWHQMHHTLDWGMMSAHRGLSFPLNNQCNQNLFLLFSLKTISPTPYKFCLMLSQSLVSHFSLYRLDLHSHAALKTFLLIDEIRWACCPSGVGGSGGPGSAGSHWPQAAVSQAGSLGSIFSERS